MRLQIPSFVIYLLATLQDAGFEAYIVGGAVRDLMLQAHGEKLESVKDYDLTTNALPEEILELIPQSYYENTFGTVSVTAEHLAENLGIPYDQMISKLKTTTTNEQEKVIELNKLGKVHQSLDLPHTTYGLQPIANSHFLAPLEITTFRSEGKYDDFRRPTEINWGKTLNEDLQRRDFTINAMAIEIKKEVAKPILEKWTLSGSKQFSFELNKTQFQIIDPYLGLEDLKNSLLKTVGKPKERFSEDALRMLRAIRLSVQLNLKIDPITYQAIALLSDNIRHISWERIGAEFMKMLRSDFAADAVEMLNETGLLNYILPELLEAKGVEQGGHHTTDVWIHSLDALAVCPSPDPVVRLATLLHDVGKPRTLKLINGKPTFYNHEIVGARMAKQIAYRLRLSNSDIERVYLLVRQHMFYYQPEHTDAAIRRFMRNVGLDNLNDILAVREADRLGSGARKTSWRLEEMKQRMIDQLHQPFSITDLKINGSDLMTEFKLKPGPIIGKTLNYLFEKVMEDPELNNNDSLIKLSKSYIKENT